MIPNDCPICHGELKYNDHAEQFFDHKCCGTDSSDHFYIHRLQNDEIIKVKFRIEDLVVRINFDEGNTQIWMKNSFKKTVTINSIFQADFSDLEKIKRKIKTLLTFS